MKKYSAFVITLLLFHLFPCELRSQDRDTLTRIENAWSSENAAVMASFFRGDSKTYIKLDSRGGYYSREQARGVIRKYFESRSITGLAFQNSETSTQIRSAEEKADGKVRKLRFTFVRVSGKYYISVIRAQ